jgi:hypothetical protein
MTSLRLATKLSIANKIRGDWSCAFAGVGYVEFVNPMHGTQRTSQAWEAPGV